MTHLTKIRQILPRLVKIKLVLLLAGVVIGGFVETLTIAILQPFLLIVTDPEIIYENHAINMINSLLGLGDVVSLLAFFAVAIAAVYAFRGFYIYFFTKIQNKILAKSSAELSNRVLLQTLKQPYLFHANRNILELQRKVINSVQRFFSVISSTLAFLIDAFMSLFILIFLLISSASMTLIVLFLVSICLIVYFKIFKKRILSSGEEEARGMMLVNKSAMQALYGIKEIKTMQKESYFVNKFKNLSFNTVEFRAQMQSLRSLPKLFIESLCFCGAFIIIAGMILAGVDLQMLLPQLGVFVVATFKLLPAASRITTTVMQIMRQMRSIGIVYDSLFVKEEEFLPQTDVPEIEVVSRDIVVSNMTFSYPNTKWPVLRDVSFVIPKNKSVAFIGASGAGKSTLVDIILGILPPQQGVVSYNGQSIHHKFGKWAKHIGYVPQVIYLLDETILENVAFGEDSDKIDEKKVWRALEQAQLKDFVMELPDKLQSMIGDRGVRISGGQRQRIGIARALYNDPPILVLDEATSSLDVETENAVMEAIKGFKGSKTMIIVAHRLSTIEHCDIVYRVKKRKVSLVRGALENM